MIVHGSTLWCSTKWHWHSIPCLIISSSSEWLTQSVQSQQRLEFARYCYCNKFTENSRTEDLLKVAAGGSIHRRNSAHDEAARGGLQRRVAKRHQQWSCEGCGDTESSCALHQILKRPADEEDFCDRVAFSQASQAACDPLQTLHKKAVLGIGPVENSSARRSNRKKDKNEPHTNVSCA